MKTCESLLLVVLKSDEGLVKVRRKDARPITRADIDEAVRLVDSSPGITVADVLSVWPGAKVTSRNELH